MNNLEDKNKELQTKFNTDEIKQMMHQLEQEENMKKSRQVAEFQFQRRIGLNKVVSISNTSGKTAYVILTPAPINTIKSICLGGGALGFNVKFDITFEDKGEYKAQQIPILNNQTSEYDLDNSQFYCTVFLHIDSKWKESWKNRKINGTKYDINILERHVTLANELETFPK